MQAGVRCMRRCFCLVPWVESMGSKAEEEISMGSIQMVYLAACKQVDVGLLGLVVHSSEVKQPDEQAIGGDGRIRGGGESSGQAVSGRHYRCDKWKSGIGWEEYRVQWQRHNPHTEYVHRAQGARPSCNDTPTRNSSTSTKHPGAACASWHDCHMLQHGMCPILTPPPCPPPLADCLRTPAASLPLPQLPQHASLSPYMHAQHPIRCVLLPHSLIPTCQLPL